MAPSTEKEIIDIVERCRESKTPLKFVGSSHSFSHIIADDSSVLLSLESYAGILKIDESARTVRVKAGTSVHDLSRALWAKGWALENLGDIEEQALGGAICTGTHGTGVRYKNLAGFVREFTLVSPDRGRQVLWAEDPEFKSTAVGAFAFGLVTEYVLDIVPKYLLKLDMFPASMSEFESNFKEWVYQNRNAEVFWFPGSESALVKLTNEVQDQNVEIKNKKSEFFANYIENKAFGLLNRLNKSMPFCNGALVKILEKLLPSTTKIDYSYKVYATVREVRFQETEWSLPITALFDVLKEMRAVVGKGNFKTLFPVEFRFVKKDDLHLSPSYGAEDRVYIAAHTYYKDSFYREYFRQLQQIFLRYGGRPHWGKMFFATAADFQGMYPMLDKVCSLRELHDSQGLLPTTTLKECVFGNFKKT